jgi:hypothetical protein
MRLALGGVLLTIGLLGCGGDSGPDEPFPDVAGVYEIQGTFDDLPANEASFEGTLELTQASQETGTIGGSLAVLATLGEDIVNVTDDALASASVSPSGVIAFSAGQGSATWTFSGTASENSIINGRHTLSAGSDNFSGPWRADIAGSVRAAQIAPGGVADLLHLLRDR